MKTTVVLNRKTGGRFSAWQVLRPVRLPSGHRIAQALSIPLFLGFWQWISGSGMVNALLFPPPTEVALALYTWAAEGTLWQDLGMSVSRVVMGFLSGAATGVFAGILTGRFPIADGFLTPIFSLLRPIPPIAFVPIVILWFGLSEWGKYFLVFWGIFFTLWLATHLGVRRVDKTLIRAAQSLGTPEHKMLRHVLLPGALPYIFVGLRTSVSISFYTLVAAELAGAFYGVAYRIDISHQNLQIGQMLAGLVVLGLMSATADLIFRLVSRRIAWWE
ncbi:ABC transporter permease [Allohahella marinimesophila]|uniref:ABC transporter permease n=1 Tax=Allohahella marinimesophila TaxID=1054972 RepID=A0ABP7PF86_9GAMM